MRLELAKHFQPERIEFLAEKGRQEGRDGRSRPIPIRRTRAPALAELGVVHIAEIFDDSVVSRRMHVSIDEAYEECQNLARQGLFMGQSSGAYLRGVRRIVQEMDRGVVVTILCDLGERYFSTRLWA